MTKSDRLARRLNREKKTIEIMIRMYCDGQQHRNDDGLCRECSDLLEYANRRIQRCPYGENKPACDKCPTHCYVEARRRHIKTVMRWAGPRMMWRHPLLAVRHLLDGRKMAANAKSAGEST